MATLFDQLAQQRQALSAQLQNAQKANTDLRNQLTAIMTQLEQLRQQTSQLQQATSSMPRLGG